MHEKENPARISQELDGASSDEELIFEETAAMSDRDQIFAEGWRQNPAVTETDADGDWSGEQEEGIKGERDFDEDLVDALERLPYLSEAVDPLAATDQQGYHPWAAALGDEPAPETLGLRARIRPLEEGKSSGIR